MRFWNIEIVQILVEFYLECLPEPGHQDSLRGPQAALHLNLQTWLEPDQLFGVQRVGRNRK